MPPELPLLVSSQDHDGLFKDVYNDIVGRVKFAPASDFIYADMGAFVVANAPGKIKILHTSGAATCTVMLVHMRRGIGALGHYYALGDPKKEVGGIVQMVEQCNKATGENADPVSVALSAGACGEGFVGKMISGIKSLYPSCRCQHVEGNDTLYGACVYIPQSYRAAFLDNPALRLTGPPRCLDGLAQYEYDQRDANLN